MLPELVYGKVKFSRSVCDNDEVEHKAMARERVPTKQNNHGAFKGPEGPKWSEVLALYFDHNDPSLMKCQRQFIKREDQP